MFGRRSLGLLGVAAALAVGLAACGGSSGRGASPPGSSSPSTGSSGPSSSAGQKFGTLASPCGSGDAKGATDRGVTNSSITIGYGDDKGYSASPGLNHEMGDAVKAFIKWCNDQGGINGRQVVGHYYDAKITLANIVMTEACKTDFMMVGEGFAADGTAEATRIGCNMVVSPGFTALPALANGPMVYQGVPYPVDVTPTASYHQMAKLFPDAVKKLAFVDTSLESNHIALEKARQPMIDAGFKFAGCDVTLNYLGESSYAPFVRELKDCGATILFTFTGVGSQLFNLLTTMHQMNYNPIFLLSASDYSDQLSKWNTSGYGNNIYLSLSNMPFEEANDVPATKQYIDIVKSDGGDISFLGEQSASSFLLWATAAKECGSNLTRQCMVNKLSQVHKWDAGGLQATTDPGNNMPAECAMTTHLTDTTWARVFPKKPGTFDCSPSYIAKVPSSLWGTKLNSDRISTQFLTPTVIKPQT